MTIKGISETNIRKLSRIKKESKWMTDFRVMSFNKFSELSQPSFGPDLRIDFDEINCYKKITEHVEEDWNKVSNKIKDVLKNNDLHNLVKNKNSGIGIQYESEAIYFNLLESLKDKNIIFCDIDTALKKYPKLFKKYFNNLVKFDENEYTALNSSIWSGGTFIYIPPNTNVDIPFINYYFISDSNICQSVRNLIIVDENSSLEYKCEYYSTITSNDSIHNEVTEVYVGKNAKCKFTTIEKFEDTIFNINIKRAIVEECATMEWYNENSGSKVNMEYPTCILNGKYSKGKSISIIASDNQISDIGAKMIHILPNTTSEIICNSASVNGGDISFRSNIKIAKKAINSNSSVKIEAKILDKDSKINIIPKNISENNSSVINYNSKITK